MPRQPIFIPLSKGLDQKLDERLRQPDSLALATNGYYKRGGALTKRHGFTPVTSTGYTYEGTDKGLLSSGDELLIRGNRSLWALIEGNATLAPAWFKKGALAPFTGAERPMFSDSLSVQSCDTAHIAGYAIHAATTLRYVANGLSTGLATSLVYKIEAENAANEIKPTTIIASDPVSTYAEIGGARVVTGAGIGVGESVAFVSCQRLNTTTLQFYRWSSFTPTTAPAVSVTHTDLSSYALDVTGNSRAHDSTSLGTWPTGNAGQWAYCYVRRAGAEIYVARMIDNVTIASWLILPAFGRAWMYCAIADGPRRGQIYILAADDADNVYLHAYTQNGVLNWSRLMPSSGFQPYNLGVVEGLNDDRVVTIIVRGSVIAPTFYNLDISATNSVNSVVPLLKTVRNCGAVSKPWSANDRFFVATRPLYPSGSNGYCSEIIFDLYQESSFIHLTAPVGRYNFGVTPSLVKSFRNLPAGSLQTVQRKATVTTEYRYGTHRITADAQNQEPTLAADIVDLDLNGKVSQGSASQGGTTFGGSSVSYYTGQAVTELGFASGPFVARTASVVDATSTLAAGTYTYMGVFESYDEKGNLTRSVPGPTATRILFIAGLRVDVEFYTLGPTQRYLSGKRFQVALFRADQDGVFQRCSKPLANTFDSEATQFFPVIRDTGEQYDAIYTQSGAEVDAAGPDGAAFVMVGSKRVWLAGFFRRDRVQYSKLYNASTANQIAIAPEFNDAFSFLIPGGEPVTGLGELDDKTIIFTAGKIYAVAGTGPDDGGRSNDFSGLQLISSDSGCIDVRSVVETPAGLFFQSQAGMMVLGRDLQINFIGAAILDTTDEFTQCTSGVLVPRDNHVRFTLRNPTTNTGCILCYDFAEGAWLRWDVRTAAGVLDPVGATMHKGEFYVLSSAGIVYKEDLTSYWDSSTLYVPMKIETGWLQAAQQSGLQRVRQVAAMCKKNNRHDLTISLFQDFDSTTPTQTQTYGEATIDNQKLIELEVMRVKVQKCTSFKIRIEDAASAGSTTGQGYDCSGFTVELAGKRGLYKPGTQQRN